MHKNGGHGDALSLLKTGGESASSLKGQFSRLK